MTAHEQDLYNKLEVLILQNRKGLSPWSNRKLVAAIISLITVLTGLAIAGTSYISTRRSTVHANENQATMLADIGKDFLRQGQFDAGQKAQDELVATHLHNVTQKLDRVDLMVEGIAKSVYRIEGQLSVKPETP